MVKGINSETWAIPSGGIEEGETPEECFMREVKEETGYDIVIEDNLFIKESQFHNRANDIKIRTMLISVPGERFPRARLQSPRHYVPAGLSAKRE